MADIPYLTPIKMRLPRKAPAHVRALNRRHAIHIGEIALAWNALQGSLYQIFFALIGDNETAFGLWHTIQSDKTQRDMLVSTAKARLANRKRLLRNLEWVVQKATVLGTFRNDAIPTPMNFRSGGFAADPLVTRKQALERLQVIPDPVRADS